MSRARKIDYDDAYDRRACGQTFSEIAAAYGVGVTTAANAVYRMEGVRGPAQPKQTPAARSKREITEALISSSAVELSTVQRMRWQDVREAVWSILITDRDDAAAIKACAAGGCPITADQMSDIRIVVANYRTLVGDRSRGERGVDDALEAMGVERE